jgi:hypothetical protein
MLTPRSSIYFYVRIRPTLHNLFTVCNERTAVDYLLYDRKLLLLPGMR